MLTVVAVCLALVNANNVSAGFLLYLDLVCTITGRGLPEL